MIQIKTLNDISIETLTDTFNLAFSDYIVPLKLSKEELLVKMKMDNVDLAYSVGAYQNNKLLGFILHGSDIIDNKRIIYNGGTGVIPEARGKNITQQMYNYIISDFKEIGIHSIILEAITQNTPAIKTYSSVGFKKKRILKCYQGYIDVTNNTTNIDIKGLNNYDWKVLQSFWDFAPTWQNNSRVVEDTQSMNLSLGAYRHDELVGYLIFNPQNKRIVQIAVNRRFRHQGIGSALINKAIEAHGNNLSVINVDERAESTNTFLLDIGFKNDLNQVEMKLDLS